MFAADVVRTSSTPWRGSQRTVALQPHLKSRRRPPGCIRNPSPRTMPRLRRNHRRPPRPPGSRRPLAHSSTRSHPTRPGRPVPPHRGPMPPDRRARRLRRVSPDQPRARPSRAALRQQHLLPKGRATPQDRPAPQGPRTLRGRRAPQGSLAPLDRPARVRQSPRPRGVAPRAARRAPQPTPRYRVPGRHLHGLKYRASPKRARPQQAPHGPPLQRQAHRHRHRRHHR